MLHLFITTFKRCVSPPIVASLGLGLGRAADGKYKDRLWAAHAQDATRDAPAVRDTDESAEQRVGLEELFRRWYLLFRVLNSGLLTWGARRLELVGFPATGA